MVVSWQPDIATKWHGKLDPVVITNLIPNVQAWLINSNYSIRWIRIPW